VPDQILIIDDSPLVRGLLAEMLSQAGFDAMTASDGAAGLQLANPSRIAAVLCDLEMPGLSGLEVVQALKARHPELPVVMLTDTVDLATAVAAMQRGAFGYLTKGTPDHAVVDELRKAIAHRRTLERNRELERQAHAHDEKLAVIGAMVAGVAHEVNNPLTVLKANSRFVSEALPSLTGKGATRTSQEVAQALEEIEICSERITRIVDDLKRIVRKADAGACCELGNALKEAQLMCRGRLPVGLTVHYEIHDTPMVRISQDDLVLIVSNLVINAGHAVEGVGPTARVEITTRVVEAQVTVEVADNGCGISPENLAKVCQPFFTTKPAGIGTGLGLSLVQQVVKSAGGTLTIQSVVGKGSSIRVCLPVVAPPNAARAA
jgi:two-component system NtrC family sensor kinase